MRKPILFALLAITSLVAISYFFIPDQKDHPTSNISKPSNVSYDVPNRPAFDRKDIPDNIYEMICLLGHPMFVTKWDLDPDTRFIFFKGPFKDASDSNGRIYPYMYQSIKSLESKQSTGALFIDSIDEYLAKTLPDEHKQLLIPRFKGVPDQLDKLTNLLGQWDVEYTKKDPERLRVVYDKKMCLGKRLLVGAYFDIVNNRVVNTKGILTAESLQWVMDNRKKPKPDIKPLKYTQNIPEEGTAKHVVTQLVLLSAAGKQSEAETLVSKTQTSEFIRNELTKQAYPTSTIELDTFTYQATKYTRDSAYISVFYYFKNGSFVKVEYKVIREDGHWRVKHVS